MTSPGHEKIERMVADLTSAIERTASDSSEDERRFLVNATTRAFLQAYEAILNARPRGTPDRFTDEDLTTEEGIEAESVAATKAPPED